MDLPDVKALLLAAASARPSSGWDLARALDAALPGALEGREGGIYALLAEHERDGSLVGTWTTGPDGRPLRLYGLPGAPPPGDVPPGPSSLPHPLLVRMAREASRGVPGPFERESSRAEILRHLEAGAAAHGALGLDGAGAARAALRDFGDPWKVRTDLGRAHRGRPVVAFPRTLAERLRALAIYDLAPLTLVVLALLLVRWQVVQAYNIPTSSMEPTLHGDRDHPDFILVDKTAFRRREPRRFEVVVFYPPDEAERLEEGKEHSAFVKRCVGLGGETLDLLGGDVHVDGRLARRPPGIEDAMMVPLYELDRDLRAIAGRARLRPVADVLFEDSWRSVTGAWALRGGRLDAATGEEGEARLSYLGDLDNDYRSPEGHMGNVNQLLPAGDLEVRFLATPGAPGAVAGADLTEGVGDGTERHRLRVGPDGVTLSSGGRTWSSRVARLGPSGPVEVRFRNVDDRLTAWVDGELVLRVELPPRVSIMKEPAPGHVELVAEDGPVSFTGVRILRDIVYLREKDSTWPRRIPEGKLFMMGDNTGNSHDSRMWGPVDRDSLIGYPFAIVFPPTRAKVLR